jgi:hypothetical protein
VLLSVLLSTQMWHSDTNVHSSCISFLVKHEPEVMLNNCEILTEMVLRLVILKMNGIELNPKCVSNLCV